MKSIKTKLIIYFSAIIVTACAVLGVLSVRKASKALTAEAEDAIYSIAADAAELTESRAETELKTLEMIAMDEDIQSMDWNKQQPLLQKELEKTGFIDIAVVSPDGTARYSSGTSDQLGDTDYVIKAMQGTNNVSDLIVSRVTGDLVLMYAVPIKKNGNIVGALIGCRDGAAMSNVISDIKCGENGYAYMINSTGDVVAHPDSEKMLNQWNPIKEAKNDESLKSVAAASEKMLNEKAGVSTYSYLGNELYVAYDPVEGTDWILAVTAEKDEVLSSVPVLNRDIMIAAAVVLLAGVGLVYLIGISIANPLIEAVKHSRKIADFDISQDVPEKYLKKKDEIGKLAAAMQTITANLRHILNEISNSAEQVAASSEELTASTQQSATTAEDISKTVDEIAKGATEQAEHVQEGTAKAALLGEAIEKNLGCVESLNIATNKVQEVVDTGVKEIDELTRVNEESNNAVQDIYNVVLKTNDSSEKIGKVSSFIASIADQTNLLALNASIEAARAGDAGSGFAVVAEEIKKLAVQSATSIKEIDSIIKELQNNTQNAVAAMSRVSELTKARENSVLKSRDSYMMIASAMNDAIEVVKQLNASTQEIEHMKNDILTRLENLSAIAEENSAATEEMAASMEEQTAAVEQVANASEGLSQLAQGLQTIVQRFNVQEG